MLNIWHMPELDTNQQQLHLMIFKLEGVSFCLARTPRKRLTKWQKVKRRGSMAAAGGVGKLSSVYSLYFRSPSAISATLSAAPSQWRSFFPSCLVSDFNMWDLYKVSKKSNGRQSNRDHWGVEAVVGAEAEALDSVCTQRGQTKEWFNSNKIANIQK